MSTGNDTNTGTNTSSLRFFRWAYALLALAILLLMCLAIVYSFRPKVSTHFLAIEFDAQSNSVSTVSKEDSRHLHLERLQTKSKSLSAWRVAAPSCAADISGAVQFLETELKKDSGQKVLLIYLRGLVVGDRFQLGGDQIWEPARTVSIDKLLGFFKESSKDITYLAILDTELQMPSIHQGIDKSSLELSEAAYEEMNENVAGVYHIVRQKSYLRPDQTIRDSIIRYLSQGDTSVSSPQISVAQLTAYLEQFAAVEIGPGSDGSVPVAEMPNLFGGKVSKNGDNESKPQPQMTPVPQDAILPATDSDSENSMEAPDEPYRTIQAAWKLRDQLESREDSLYSPVDFAPLLWRELNYTLIEKERQLLESGDAESLNEIIEGLRKLHRQINDGSTTGSVLPEEHVVNRLISSWGDYTRSQAYADWQQIQLIDKRKKVATCLREFGDNVFHAGDFVLWFEKASAESQQVPDDLENFFAKIKATREILVKTSGTAPDTVRDLARLESKYISFCRNVALMSQQADGIKDQVRNSGLISGLSTPLLKAERRLTLLLKLSDTPLAKNSNDEGMARRKVVHKAAIRSVADNTNLDFDNSVKSIKERYIEIRNSIEKGPQSLDNFCKACVLHPAHARNFSGHKYTYLPCPISTVVRIAQPPVKTTDIGGLVLKAELLGKTGEVTSVGESTHELESDETPTHRILQIPLYANRPSPYRLVLSNESQRVRNLFVEVFVVPESAADQLPPGVVSVPSEGTGIDSDTKLTSLGHRALARQLGNRLVEKDTKDINESLLKIAESEVQLSENRDDITIPLHPPEGEDFEANSFDASRGLVCRIFDVDAAQTASVFWIEMDIQNPADFVESTVSYDASSKNIRIEVSPAENASGLPFPADLSDKPIAIVANEYVVASTGKWRKPSRAGESRSAELQTRSGKAKLALSAPADSRDRFVQLEIDGYPRAMILKAPCVAPRSRGFDVSDELHAARIGTVSFVEPDSGEQKTIALNGKSKPVYLRAPIPSLLVNVEARWEGLTSHNSRPRGYLVSRTLGSPIRTVFSDRNEQISVTSSGSQIVFTANVKDHEFTIPTGGLSNTTVDLKFVYGEAFKYEVEDNDTLRSVSDKFNVKQTSLIRWNLNAKLTNGEKLKSITELNQDNYLSNGRRLDILRLHRSPTANISFDKSPPDLIRLTTQPSFFRRIESGKKIGITIWVCESRGSYWP